LAEHHPAHPVPPAPSTAASAEAGHSRPVSELAVPGLRAMIAQLARHLGKNVVALVVPVGAISVALLALFGVIALLVLKDDGLIVDDQLRWFEPGPGLVALAVVAVVIGLVAQLAMTAMVVTMVAGSLLRRPVSARHALRMVARRAGALLVLLITLVAAWAVLVVVASWVATGITAAVLDAHPTSRAVRAAAEANAGWIGYPIAGVAALVLWPLPLTVPVVILDGAGPFRAWSRSAELIRDRKWHVFRCLMVTVIGLPVAVGAGLSGLASLFFTGIAHTAADLVAVTIGGVLSAVVQGAALALVALDQSPPRRPRPGAWEPQVPLDPAAVAARLPAPAPASTARPLRRRVLLTLTTLALVVPGSFYGGYLHANPHGLAALYEQPVLDSGASDDPVLLDDGTLMNVAGSWADARLCADRECDRTHTLPTFGTYDWGIGAGVTAATLPDSSWAVAKWEYNAEGDTLKLGRCTAEECTNPSQGPTLARTANGADVGIAVSGHGILVAASLDTDRDRAADTVQLLRCPGIPCDAPQTLAEVELPEPGRGGIAPIAVATGAQGRPVVAYENMATGGITLLSCEDADCRRSVTRQPVGPATFASAAEADELRGAAAYASGVELVVPPDDHPVLVHRDIRSGAARLLRCSVPDCLTADAIALTGPSEHLDVPDLALGADGLPLVATFDTPRRRAVLIACDAPDCSRRTTVDLGAYVGNTDVGPGELDMAVGRDGRPRMFWTWRLVTGYRYTTDRYLLTCRDARCGAGADVTTMRGSGR
jgi:hypothetical protein